MYVLLVFTGRLPFNRYRQPNSRHLHINIMLKKSLLMYNIKLILLWRHMCVCPSICVGEGESHLKTLSAHSTHSIEIKCKVGVLSILLL